MKKKKILFISILIITVFIAAIFTAGCASSPERSQAAGASAQTAFFNGFWELPNGQIIYIQYNAFVLYSFDFSVTNTGIILYSDSEILLNLDSEEYALFGYSKVSQNINVTSSEGNEFANGIWTKNAGLSFADGGRNPIEGYWVEIDGEYVNILHILPNGWGILYECDEDLDILVKSSVLYEGNPPTELIINLNLPEDDGQIGNYNVPFNLIFEGSAVMIGIGDDLSTYWKYIKR